MTTPAVITALLAGLHDEQLSQSEDQAVQLVKIQEQIAQLRTVVAMVKPMHEGVLADLVSAQLLPDVHLLVERVAQLEARVADINASVSLVSRQVGRMRRGSRR